MFKVSNPEYFGLSTWQVFGVKTDYYIKTGLIYHIIIVLYLF